MDKCKIRLVGSRESEDGRASQEEVIKEDVYWQGEFQERRVINNEFEGKKP